ncbi:molybdenum cofactor guanylyltransferase MobA [soil metagenome]
MHPPDRSAITGVVLCGGRGSRMGGLDKGLIEFEGQTLAERAIARLSPQVGNVLVNANRHLDRYRGFGVPIVTDANPSFDGPLAGICAAWQACSTEWLACVPCDVPFFPLDLIDRLCTGIARHDTALVAMASNAGRLHPVLALMHRDTAPTLDAYLASGGRRASGWLDAAHVQIVDLQVADDALRNLNTPDDLQAG